MQTKTLGELAEYVDGRVCGDPDVAIKSASTLGRASEGDISFLANNKYEKSLRTTKASAVIVGKETRQESAPGPQSQTAQKSVPIATSMIS
jgi:UDP-3-O-[3-hydroxymyristoyl] glucosamine N-acyltransferase